MELFPTILYTSLALYITFLALKRFGAKRRRLPPTPAGALPFLGHLHLLKPPLHRTLRRLSRTHGPIFSLKLGTRRLVVVSSPDLAEQCFTANDVVFSNRPKVLVQEYIGYNHTTAAGEPYGRRWRRLRRLGAEEVLSPARLISYSRIREYEILRTMHSLVRRNWEEKLELRPKLFEFVFNVITMMLAGKRFSGEEGIRGMVREVFESAQTSNPEDFVPILRWIDYRGLKKKLAEMGGRLDGFYGGLVAEQRRERRRDTIVGHLVELQEKDPEFYTDQIIKGFMTNMIIAGTDTSVVTIEWAISLLLNHPDVLRKAQLEIDSQVGHHRLLEEQDLPNLKYLRNIINETFRMFPAGPMLVPRESSAECVVGGYDIPRGTILLVNAWAIQRDPNVWAEPTCFKPERFEGRDEVEMHKLMPFGMGRRACPGAGLGQRMVGLCLGSLIQCFEWERVDSKEVDLDEGVGLTMPKLKPLEAMCRPREVMLEVLKRSCSY